MSYIIGIVILLLSLITISKRGKESLQIAQLEGYEVDNYLKWLDDNKDRAYDLKIKDVSSGKSPLVMTDRAKRLNIISILISALIIAIPTVMYMVTNKIFWLIIELVLVLLVYYQQPGIMAYALKLAEPIEEKINMGFYKDAQKKIRDRKDLKVVGITGSYGKTSTKFIITTILREKYNVLNTPESYNTPMGISKVINNDLKDEHEVFIAEMGAKKVGEIKELTDLCSPSIGVLTSVGPAHLESFGSIENICKTKYELIEAIPEDGVKIMNYDNKYVRELADKTGDKLYKYGINNIENLDVYAEDIEVSEMGSTFTLKDGEGNSIKCNTKLLGEHNIVNILAGASVGKAMGLSFEEISRGISKIEPIPHRLDIMLPPSGLIIIDDAFNSNPDGSKAALDVISQFKEGRKIIITPGMIELGDMEEEANREFGINIGKVCDFAILVGKERTKPIYEGIKSTDFEEENIYVVDTLDEASGLLGTLARPKDVVLFENDLPDNY